MELLVIFLIIAASSCSGHSHSDMGVRTDTDTEADVDADSDADTDTDTDTFDGLLDSGLYSIEVTGIVDLACEGVRPRDLLGATTIGGLRVDAPDATLWIDDARFDGGMAGGVLSVGGVIPRAYVEEDDDGEVDTGDTRDTDVDETEADDDAPDSGERPDVPPRGSRPWPRPAGFMTLEAEATSSWHAVGFMDVRMPDCSYVVEIEMDRYERDTDTDTETDTDVTETDTEPTEPCDEEDDCG